MITKAQKKAMAMRMRSAQANLHFSKLRRELHIARIKRLKLEKKIIQIKSKLKKIKL